MEPAADRRSRARSMHRGRRPCAIVGRVASTLAPMRENRQCGVTIEPAARSARRSRRDLGAQPPDGLLPPLPRDPALRLAGAARNRRLRGRLRPLARRADRGRGAGQPARLRRVVHPLLDAGQRLRLPRGEPVPVVPRRSPGTRSTSRSTRRCARVAGAGSSGSCSRCRRSSSRRRSAAACRRARRARRRPGRRRAATTRRSGGTPARSAASRRQRRSSRGSPSSRADARRADCATSRRMRSATARRPAAYLLLLTPRYPTSDPELAGPYAELPEHPVRVVVTTTSAPTAHRSLPILPRDPAPRLALAVVDRRRLRSPSSRWIIGLVPGRLPVPLHRFLAAYIRYATHRDRVPLSRRRRVPGLHRAARARTGSTSRSTRRPTAPLDDPLPALPRDPGVHRSASALGGVAFVVGAPRLVVRARHGADARGAAQPRASLPALLGADVCVRRCS